MKGDEENIKTYSDFGLVEESKNNGEPRYLFVVDKPKNIIEEEDPRFKCPGGNNPTGNVENFLPEKIRRETGISTKFVGRKRDAFGRRLPLIEINLDGHIFRVWKMEVSSFEEKDTPISGPNIKKAVFLTIKEIICARIKEKILDFHSLVVDQEIIRHFFKSHKNFH